MATYTYSEAAIANTARNVRLVRNWIRGFCAAALIADLYLLFDQGSWLARQVHVPNRWASSLFIVPFVLLVNTHIWRDTLKRLEEGMRGAKVETSPEGISIDYALPLHRHFQRSDIVRAEEPVWGAGIYLRTSNRYRWAVLTRRLNGYSKLRAELAAHGIPIVKTIIPPNWEEYFFAMAFCGSLILSLVHLITRGDRTLQVVNFAVAAAVGVAGFLIIGANPDNMPRMRWRGFAAFLPAVVAIVTFYL